MNGIYPFLILVLFICLSNCAKFEGDQCSTEEQPGKCVPIDLCNHAKNLLQMQKNPKICGFEKNTPIVCCPLQTAGKLSEEKCNSYYPELEQVYGPAFVGGTPTKPKEFPHMALLGYGTGRRISWLCGGSLISEQFVLTAAHCLNSRELGKVKVVRLGELDLGSTTENAKPEDFKVIQTYPHPDYKSPSHYNDIALLKINRAVAFDAYISPICLYSKPKLDDTRMKLTGTGWGKTDFLGETSSKLLKVDLDFVKPDTCVEYYANIGRNKLPNGILEASQICAGSAMGKDACQGDSGGPLQVKELGKDYYLIVGITSFGKACGGENAVGVYTRVAAFVPWIESIVWQK